MSRVSESSSFHAIANAVNKTKSRLEDLQLRGSDLKKVQKPSDNPMGNIDILSIRSRDIDNNQYQRNISFAKAQLSFTEDAIDELTSLVTKAKEIAIGQSSNIFDVDIRKSISKEVEQLRNQSVSIGNRRLGNKYIFAGFKNQTKPFDLSGNYLGDKNQTKLEVSKDFYVPINFNGLDIFYEKQNTSFKNSNQLELNIVEPANRTIASEDNSEQMTRSSIMDHLETLKNALVTNNHEVIQNLLPEFDKDLDRLVQVRTQLGSYINSLDNADNLIEKEYLHNAEYKSRIEDADVAELFTDLARQQNVLNATYKASSQLMDKSLIDFLR